MSYKDTEVAILISTYDAYYEALRISIEMFKRFWPDCKYEFIVANNTKKIDDERITLINCGDEAKSWCERALKAINETKADYYIMLMEDIFITRRVDTKEIENIIGFMKENKIDFYKLIPVPPPKGELFEGTKHIHKINKQTPYGININSAIYSREFFLEILGDGKISAWDLEERFIKETTTAPDEYFKNCVSDDRNVLNTIHGIIQGKWLKSTVKELKKLGITVDIGNRGYYPISQIIRRKTFVFVRNIVSSDVRRTFKKILSKLGFKFVTKY